MWLGNVLGGAWICVVSIAVIVYRAPFIRASNEFQRRIFKLPFGKRMQVFGELSCILIGVLGVALGAALIVRGLS